MAARCSTCERWLDPGHGLCRYCGAWTASETGNIGAVSKLKTTTLDQVKPEPVARATVGEPWDTCFGGGGIVWTSTALVGGPPGSGKALALDTPIPTVSGWTTMGEIQSGEVVFDERGELCQVMGASHIMMGRPCYEVTFSDGSSIVADADHLWHTHTKEDRNAVIRHSKEGQMRRRAQRRGGSILPYQSKYAIPQKRVANAMGAVRTTLQIASTVRIGAHANHSIVSPNPLVLPDADLPIDPYMLGIWLGDGTTAEGHYTNLDDPIAEKLRTLGFQIKKYMFANRTPRWVVEGLRTRLRLTGLLNNKHIPSMYLRASIPQRLKLLCGLMDTDGDCSKVGACAFNTTHPRLRDGFQELLATFGIRSNWTERDATLHGRIIGKAWRFTFTTSLKVFTLERKLSRQRTPSRGIDKRRYIVDVKEVASVPVRCIAVRSPSHLYLAGRHMVPTHNTTGLIQILSSLATLTGRRAYLLSAEQGPGDLRLTADRLQLPNLERFRVLSEFGVGAEIDEELLKEDPPAGMVVDSISALCGKDVHAAIAIAKTYKKYSVKYKAPAFLICHMTKEHDYAGLMALQHEVDALVTIFPEDDGIRHLKPWKNRNGSTHSEYELVMTETGLFAPLPKEKKGKGKGKVMVAVAAKLEPLLEEEPIPSPLPRPIRRERHPAKPPPKIIELDGQTLVRKPRKGEKSEPAADRAHAVEGEALKRRRPAMAKLDPGPLKAKLGEIAGKRKPKEPASKKKPVIPK
jgi:hypothetical protein